MLSGPVSRFPPEPSFIRFLWADVVESEVIFVDYLPQSSFFNTEGSLVLLQNDEGSGVTVKIRKGETHFEILECELLRHYL